MLRVIINADDLGKDHETNLAIEDALIMHSITSSTIMANSTTWEDIHRIVDNNSDASFGVHLNLSDGPALTKSDVLFEFGIVDKDNNFTGKARRLNKLENNLKEAIFNEWDAQISTIVNREKIDVTHLDGHHHIHMNAAYIEILCELAHKYGVKWIRRKHTSWAKSSFKKTIENAFLFSITSIPVLTGIICSVSERINCKIRSYRWHKILSKEVSFTDYFNGYEQAVEILKTGDKPSRDATIELMCHPGHPSFVKEFEMVNNHTLERLLPEAVLCSYKGLY